MELGVLVICFFAFMVMGLPIAFNLLLSSVLYLLAGGYPLILVGTKLYEGMNSFSMLSVPFFVLTGEFLLRGKLLDRLIEFTNAYFGNVRGALAVVTIITCLLMGSIVGLAVAAAASLGSFLIPMMRKEGYSPAFSAAVMTSGSLLGPIMPPSVLMILYCIAVGRTSIAGIFLTAIVPAVLITAIQAIIVHRKAVKRGYPRYGKTTWKEKWTATKGALPVLLLPVLILGGIFGNVFTVTEASAVAALYSFILAFIIKREVKLSELPDIFIETASTTGLVLLLAGSGTVVAWAVANERVIDLIIGPLSSLPVWLFLLMVNVLLLIVGMFMDDYASIVVIAPLIAPIAWRLGIDPLHIGVIICINLVIGLATPPFGIALFVTSPMAGVTIEENFREVWPMIAGSIAVLLLITYVPSIVLWLPRMMGY